MSENAAPSIRQLALGDLDAELGTTRRLLERLPDEQLAWKPHEKSFSLGSLATHLATLPVWLVSIVQEDFFDVGAPMPKQEPLGSRDAVLEVFDRNAAAFRDALDAADDDVLARRWEMRIGEAVSLAAPKHAVLRSIGINHIIHHRGQLSVYLRVLEVPLPPIYGPTADERGGF
jgi:uncharacterized damage-inducible protein DinB